MHTAQSRKRGGLQLLLVVNSRVFGWFIKERCLLARCFRACRSNASPLFGHVGDITVARACAEEITRQDRKPAGARLSQLSSLLRVKPGAIFHQVSAHTCTVSLVLQVWAPAASRHEQFGDPSTCVCDGLEAARRRRTALGGGCGPRRRVCLVGLVDLP